MARVVVDVMLKPEILDPAGQAVAGALPRLGINGVASVRIGKRIEIDFAGVPDLDQARMIADRLLANPVIEDFTLRMDEPDLATMPGGPAPMQPIGSPLRSSAAVGRDSPEPERSGAAAGFAAAATGYAAAVSWNGPTDGGTGSATGSAGGGSFSAAAAAAPQADAAAASSPGVASYGGSAGDDGSFAEELDVQPQQDRSDDDQLWADQP